MKLHYQCEICGTIYEREDSAKFCESFPTPTPKFQVGEVVAIQLRYDGVVQDRILSMKLVYGHNYINLDHVDLERYPNFKGIAENYRIHEWAYQFANYHQITKDRAYDSIFESSLEKVEAI